MPRDRSPGNAPEDLGQVYDRLGPELYSYARVILGGGKQAEDVIHDVFVAALQTPETLPQVLDGYLFRSVRNACWAALKRRHREEDQGGDGELLEAREGFEDAVNERLQLQAALRSLPPAQREVIYLRSFEGRTFREISELVGDSINLVTSRYRHALDNMQRFLQGLK
jgi:RNA polymerase sigma-70 factor (ECF subfamily)